MKRIFETKKRPANAGPVGIYLDFLRFISKSGQKKNNARYSLPFALSASRMIETSGFVHG
ncbi:MAG: hypothetical protein IKQ66_04165 [Treponema sp.]|nr:hypothetical protein [Treponema sp.]